MAHDYLDFELLIERVGDAYRAQVVRSPVGEARHTFTLPPDAQGWSTLGPGNQRARGVIDPTLTPQPIAPATSARAVGERLFNLVFGGDLLLCYLRSLDAAERAKKGLRLRLRLSQAPELAEWPWEYLYIRNRNLYLALSEDTPVVRYLDLPVAVDNVEVTLPIRVLAVISSPADLPALDVNREWEDLQQALAPVQEAGRLVLDRLDQATWPALQAQLQQTDYHIFHFIGHGAFDPTTQEGGLALEDDDEQSRFVAGQALGALLHDHPSLRLAVLNACEGGKTSEQDAFAGVAQSFVQQGIGSVIAMQFKIGDNAAIHLARSFYQAIAEGLPIDAALGRARKALFAESAGHEWGTPVLYMRAADGVIWRPPPDTTAARLRMVRLALVALGLIALGVGLVAWRLRGPSQMTGGFNVAVAQFGPEDKDSLLSNRIYREVQRELDHLPERDRSRYNPQVWHDSLAWTEKGVTLGSIEGATPQARALAAAQRAKDINAHVLIYGYVDKNAQPPTFVPEFYVQKLQGEADEIVGLSQLGTPIPIRLPIDPKDADLQRFMNEELNARSVALALFTIGLIYDLDGQPSAALKVFQSILTQDIASAWEENEGKEILYYFIGRQHLFLKQLDEAQAQFEKALNLNPTYARAKIGLGGVYRTQAYDLPVETRLEQPAPGCWFFRRQPEAERARRTIMECSQTAYQAASQDTATDPGSQTALVARVGLAQVYRLEGETQANRGDPLAAEPALQAAIREIDAAIQGLPPDQHRLIALAQLELGAAYHQLGHILVVQGRDNDAKAPFTQADKAYGMCITEANQPAVQFDRYIQSIKNERCIPYQKIVREASR